MNQVSTFRRKNLKFSLQHLQILRKIVASWRYSEANKGLRQLLAKLLDTVFRKEWRDSKNRRLLFGIQRIAEYE
jgi:hypothetical protein